MRVVVTGAGGQLGSEVLALLGDHQVTGTDRKTLDVGDQAAVRELIGSIRPDAVVNCAAFTDVDGCETDPARAHRDNARAVGYLAEACADVGAHLTTISTDYVFDGAQLTPYAETDAPNPLSVYGRSKLDGESAVGVGATVVRTSWLCGARGSNMVETVLSQLEGRARLRYVADRVANPTFVTDLAPVVVGLSLDRRAGLYHVTNQGSVSPWELARAVAESAGADPDRVESIAAADLNPPRLAPRPTYSVLDNAALRAAGEPVTRHYAEPLDELVAVLRSV